MGLPTSYEEDTGKLRRVRQVLWGDWLQLAEDRRHPGVGNEWTTVNWAPRTDDLILYIPKEQTTDRRPREISFLDVSQGDGAVLITAFKLESDSDTKKWFYYEYLIDDAGKLSLA